MKITWFGHSCFKVEKDGYAVVIDPYKDGSVPGYLPVNTEANEVLCTHGHGDHSGREEVTLLHAAQESPFTVAVIDTYHDEVQGKKRGTNQIFIISDGAQKIAHLGDLGCELESEQMAKLLNLDCIMVPVGGFYTIDGKQAADLIHRLNPRIVIPMHYRDAQKGFGYDEIDTVNTFKQSMENVMTISNSEIETEHEFPMQVVVMQALRAEK